MADNRKIKNKVRGEGGVHFDYGMEDQLAATYDQRRLDELKASGAIEGDWTSTKPPMTVTGGNLSSSMAGRVADSGAQVATAGGDEFQPLSIEDTIAAMKRYDFSERVTRSMTFHGDALKDALKSNKSPAKSGEKSTDGVKFDEDGFPEGFPAYGKMTLKKLGKSFEEILLLDREKFIELDGIAEKSADEIIAFIEQLKTGDK